jgi:hypothetical protein
LALKGQALKPSGKSRSTSIAAKSLRDTSRTRSDSATSDSAENTISSPLTCSAEDSHARTSATLEIKQELTAKSQVFGERCIESFASYDRGTSQWRTSQRSLFGGLSEFLGTWPAQGMTLSGEAFGLPILGLCIAGSECSLLPTMRASMSLVGAPIWKRTPNRGNLEEILAELYPHLIGQLLNVQAGEWLMGFPIDWTALEDSATPSSRKSRNGSAKG